MYDIYLYFPAIIIIIGTSLGDNDVIILAPPTSVSVTEGDAVSLPCIGSRGTAPTFFLGGVALPTNLSGPYSLDFASIDLSDNGTYTCQIGEATATVTINVTAMIRKYKFASVYIVPCN